MNPEFHTRKCWLTGKSFYRWPQGRHSWGRSFLWGDVKKDVAVPDEYWTVLIVLGLYLYLRRLKNIGQIRLLPAIFPPQRKTPQTWGHLNLGRTLGAHKQKLNFIILTWSSLKGAVWKLVFTLKFAEQTGHLVHRIVDGLNGICDNLLNICRTEQWNKTQAWY